MFYKFSQPVNIIAYGSYVPKLKINTNEIIDMGLPNNYFKAVPDLDEDTATFSLNIAQNLITAFPKTKYQEIAAIYVGSESHPYSVKPTGTILSEYLNIRHTTSANLEFACKAGTAAMQIIAAEVASGMIKTGLAIGVDISQARPGDALETTAGAGGAGFIISSQSENALAKILFTASTTSNTPDFWRRKNQPFPEHAGRFTALPGYIKHVSEVFEKILEQSQIPQEKIDYFVFHSPNMKLPDSIAKRYRINLEKLIHSQIFPHIGNAYAGSSMLGLAHALDLAQPNQRILVVSYGSGAGSDGFIIETTKNIAKNKSLPTLIQQINHRQEINFRQYITNHQLLIS